MHRCLKASQQGTRTGPNLRNPAPEPMGRRCDTLGSESSRHKPNRNAPLDLLSFAVGSFWRYVAKSRAGRSQSAWLPERVRMRLMNLAAPSDQRSLAQTLRLPLAMTWLIWVSTASPLYSAPGIEWELHSEGDPGDAHAGSSGFDIDAHGSTFMASHVRDPEGFDLLLTRRAPDGSLLWSVRYSHPSGGDDYAASVAMGADGNPIVRIGGPAQALAKFRATDGLMLWYTDLGASDGGFAVAADGGVYVGGSTARKLRGDDGGLVWETPELGASYGVRIAPRGDPILFGTALGPSLLPEMTAIRLDANTGAEVWRAQAVHPGGLGSVAVDAAIGADGAVVVAGRSEPWSSSNYWVARFEGKDGILSWARSYDGSGSSFDRANAVAIDPNGDVIVTGDSMGRGMNPNFDFATVKWRGRDGSLLWVARFDGNAADRAVGIALAANGDVLVGGETNGSSGSGTQVAIVRYGGATGERQWSRTLAGDTAYGYFGGVRVDAQDGAWVGAMQFNATNDHTIVHLDASSGNLRWSANEGPAHSRQSFCGHAERLHVIDAVGSSFVLGCSFDGLSDDLLVQKILPSGRRAWSRRIGGPGHAFDDPAAIALAPNGDVVIVGTTERNTGDPDTLVLRLAGDDGAIRWQARHDGEASVAVFDAAGDVMVAGQGAGTVGNYDALARKYDGASGATLWTWSYGGAAGRHDITTAAAALAGGDFVLLMSSDETSTSSSVTVARLARENGGQRWLRSHPAVYRSDYAESMALDTQDHVVVAAKAGSRLLLLKYSLADGAIAWTREDAEFYVERPPRLVVDAGGALLVTAKGFTLGTAGPQFLAKFAAAGGAALWRRALAGGCERSAIISIDANQDPLLLRCVDPAAGLPHWELEAIANANGATRWITPLNLFAYPDSSAGDLRIRTGAGRARIAVGARTGVGGRIVVQQIDLDLPVLADGFESVRLR